MAKRRVLFFTAGMVPTAEERLQAEKVGTKMFRNASLAAGDFLEKCDAVAGLVPASYAARYPTPEAATENTERAKQAELDAQRAEIAAAEAKEQEKKDERARAETEARVRAETDRIRAEEEARARLEAERAAADPSTEHDAPRKRRK